MNRPRIYSSEVRRQAVLRVLAGEPAPTVARDLGIERRRLYDWCERARRQGLGGLRGPGRPPKQVSVRGVVPSEVLEDEGRAARRRIAELERKVGRQQADLDFFRQALRHVKARQQVVAGAGAPRSGKSSGR